MAPARASTNREHVLLPHGHVHPVSLPIGGLNSIPIWGILGRESSWHMRSPWANG